MKNQKGFGLVELMVTMGILSFVMLALMQATMNAMLVSATADTKNALSSLVASTAGQVFDQTTCTLAVIKVSQNYGQPFQFDGLKDGTVLPQYFLTVQSLTFANPALIATGYDGTKVYRGTMTMTAKANRQVYGGQTFAPRTIAAFYVTADPAGKIIGCGPILPTLPTAPTPPAPPANNEPTDDFKRGCSAAGGEMSNGTCTFHSQGGKNGDQDGDKKGDDDCDKQR